MAEFFRILSSFLSAACGYYLAFRLRKEKHSEGVLKSTVYPLFVQLEPYMLRTSDKKYPTAEEWYDIVHSVEQGNCLAGVEIDHIITTSYEALSVDLFVRYCKTIENRYCSLCRQQGIPYGSMLYRYNTYKPGYTNAAPSRIRTAGIAFMLLLAAMTMFSPILFGSDVFGSIQPLVYLISATAIGGMSYLLRRFIE